MTMHAAKLLDQAFNVFYSVATHPDGSRISAQTPSWSPPSTPYDFAAGLVKSLIPYAYNLQTGAGVDPATRRLNERAAEWIYDEMLDCMDVIPITRVNEWFAQQESEVAL